MPTKLITSSSINEVLVSGYGTGLTNNQKLSRAWVLKPTVYSTETVAAGNGSGNATELSTTTTVSLVTTATNQSHVSLADGVEGQLKIIIHKTRGGSNDLVITPANLRGYSTITLNAQGETVTCLFKNSNWNVIAGNGYVLA